MTGSTIETIAVGAASKQIPDSLDQGAGVHVPPASVFRSWFNFSQLVHPRYGQRAPRPALLENVLLGLLSQASEEPLDHIGALAGFLSPRPGATQHPLTIHAATQMNQLVERARHFRS